MVPKTAQQVYAVRKLEEDLHYGVRIYKTVFLCCVNLLIVNQADDIRGSKARFPLPELTARVDG